MQCSFDEEVEHPDGTFTHTTCIQKAEILLVSDSCCGLCYTCAYRKMKAENTKLKEEIVNLQELLHYGCQDQTMISIIHKAKVNKEEALNDKIER